LPLNGIYKLRGAVYWGLGTTLKYDGPCSTTRGLACETTDAKRDVRSIIGLSVGTELGQTALGRTTILEAGLALHGQITTSISGAFDFASRAGGFQWDFAGQLGSFYAGFEVLFFGHDGAFPALFLVSTGYTPAMW
jgi:hypothetical protein